MSVMSRRPLTRGLWARRAYQTQLPSTLISRRYLNIVPKCPDPTCECADTPAMPEGLEIDHKGKLNGLISSYAEQVLVCTGKSDWTSRIEEDDSGDNLAADLKELIGRGGVYSDVSRSTQSGEFLPRLFVIRYPAQIRARR